MHRRMAFAVSLVGFAVYCPAATTVPATITLSPATAQLRTSEQKTFSFSTKGYTTAPTPVWKVVSTASGVTGDLGSVTSKGVYTAPAVVPTPNTVMVQAVDPADAKVFGSATVTLLSPLPRITSLSPTRVNIGLAYTVAINGTGFLPSSLVQLDGVAVKATFVSPTALQISGKTAAAAESLLGIVVSNPGPDAVSNKASLEVEPPMQVKVYPSAATLRIGTTKDFSVSVTDPYKGDSSVAWAVNGIAGGNAAVGTIDAAGLYTPPAVLPPVAAGSPAGTSPTVTVSAVSTVDPTAKGSSVVTIQNGIPKITGVVPSTLPVGKTSVTINGTGFAPGGTVTIAGVKLTPTFVSDRQLKVDATIAMPVGRIAPLKVSNPAPGPETSTVFTVPVRVTGEKLDYASAVRFLETASWGPTPASVSHLQQIGIPAWLAEQFAMPATPLPDPNDSNEGVARLQDAFFTNALTGQDQLRQRVAFALSEIMVVSSEKDTHFAEMVSYYRLLLNDAFGNFRNLLGDVTLSPAMGHFLDMVNNDKANPAKNTVANENYAREVMQLFTVGLVRLDPQTGVATTVPEYDQSTVTEMAKVFTGWTYPPLPGFASHWQNAEYNNVPMVAFQDHHDTTQKNLNLPIPCTVPAGGTAASDLNQALDCLAKQTNVAPFISYRLIQRLVMSNPSTNYVQRVSTVFNNSNGNLQAVVTAILTDPEALAPTTGKLLEPVLFSTHLLRSLNATVTGAATGIRGQTEAMGQKVLGAPSVFNYFSPTYKVAVPNFPTPGATTAQTAPEFQLMNAETAFARINFAYRAVNNQLSGNIRVDTLGLLDIATDPAALLDAIDQALYRGQMASGEKLAVLSGINLSTSPSTRVVNGLYVAAAAPQFQVER